MPDPTLRFDFRPGAIPSGVPVEYGGTTSSPGRRFVPAPTPWQAGYNTFLRNYTPWGPFGVDEPPTGTGGWTGKILGATPYAGGLLQAIMAGAAAREQTGQMVEVPPATGWFQNLLKTLGNVLALTPSPAGAAGSALSMAKLGISGAQGFAGAPGMFNTSWEQVLAGMGGMAVRGLADRTGLLQSITQQSPAPAVDTGRYTYTPPVAPSNPFTIDGFTPAWAGGPSTWNQPASTWGIPGIGGVPGEFRGGIPYGETTMPGGMARSMESFRPAIEAAGYTMPSNLPNPYLGA